MNFYKNTISKNNTNNGTLKRVHTEVSDFKSSDEESTRVHFKKSKTLTPGQGYSSLGHPMTKP